MSNDPIGKDAVNLLDTTNTLDDAVTKEHGTAVDRAMMSQLALAKLAFESGQVVHVTQLKAFMVQGTSLPYSVTLFPKVIFVP